MASPTPSRLSTLVSALLILIFATMASAGTASAQNAVTIADFTSKSKYLPRQFETVNDPVMGGTSHSTSKPGPSSLVWWGEVNIVSFLRSPGFCILQTAGRQTFDTLSDTAGISFLVDQESTMLLPMGAQVLTGAKSASFGVEVTYVATLSERRRQGGMVELYAPWDSFKATFRGQDIRDAPPLDGRELDRTYRIGLSTYPSHKAGPFRVEVAKIIAGLATESEW